MSDRWAFGIHSGPDEISAKSIFSHLPDEVTSIEDSTHLQRMDECGYFVGPATSVPQRPSSGRGEHTIYSARIISAGLTEAALHAGTSEDMRPPSSRMTATDTMVHGSSDFTP
jgi:hypothetical protein